MTTGDSGIALFSVRKTKNKRNMKNLSRSGFAPLTKKSNTEQIKAYFTQVFKMKNSGEDFPADLDMVWPLIYSEKGKAVRALKNNPDFMQDVDYQFLAPNGKNSKNSLAPNGKQKRGGRSREVCNLSVSCLEYFIVRKKRPIFEIYRIALHTLAQASNNSLPAYDILADFYKNTKQLEINDLSYFHLADVLFFIGSRAYAYIVAKRIGGDNVYKVKHPGVNASYFVDFSGLVIVLQDYEKKHTRAFELLKKLQADKDNDTDGIDDVEFFKELFGAKVGEHFFPLNAFRKANELTGGEA